MSLAVLKQTYDEVRRLAIAGSVVSANDFRLKKVVAPLEQAGQKAPVFAKVAEGVTKLLGASEQESAAALLDVSTLVNAILYTQGETGAAGELAPIASRDLGQHQTRASARTLKPLIEALTTTGSGRLEVIKDAHERGAFRDLRLVAPALAALDDPYADIGDFMATQVLPMYGQAIVTELSERLDLKGRGGHVHRLLLMHRLDPEAARATIEWALEDGSKELRVAAIECLGSSPQDLAYLLEQAKAKAKDVRAAALRALSRCEAAEAADALRGAFRTGSIELAVDAVASSTNPRLAGFMMEEVQSLWDGLLAGGEKDKAKLGKQVARLLVGLQCLQGRQDAAAEKFLIDAFANRDALAKIKGEPGGKDVEQKLAALMSRGPRGAQQALIDAHATLPEDELAEAFRAACQVLSPAEVFDKFSPYLAGKFTLRKKSRDAAALKREAIAAGILESARAWRYVRVFYALGVEESEPRQTFDPRWLDLAVQQEHLELVQALAVPGHAGANKLLAAAFGEQLKKAADPFAVAILLQTMVSVQHPGATDAVIATIKKHAKSPRAYALYAVAPLVAELPKDALPKFEVLLAELPEKVVDQLLEHVEKLRTRA
jgi:hypothetical protein